MHSPGPWHVVGGTEVRSGSRIVCETTCYNRLDGAIEDDARLIAKAPEMKEFIRFYVEDFAIDGDVESMRKMGRELLAQIDGGS